MTAAECSDPATAGGPPTDSAPDPAPDNHTDNEVVAGVEASHPVEGRLHDARMTPADRARAEREAQGLSPTVDDPATIARVVRLVRAADMDAAHADGDAEPSPGARDAG